MSTEKRTTDWAEALFPFGIAAIVLAFFLGIGGCYYLLGKGVAAEKSAARTKEAQQ